jgi:hypothetical protein
MYRRMIKLHSLVFFFEWLGDMAKSMSTLHMSYLTCAAYT